MAKQKNPVQTKPQSKSEAPKKVAKAKKWNCNLYIRGFGRVNKGDEATKEALALVKDSAKYLD